MVVMETLYLVSPPCIVWYACLSSEEVVIEKSAQGHFLLMVVMETPSEEVVNPRRACTGYCTWSVCVCACVRVCLSVCLSADSCPPFFPTTAAAVSFKRGYVSR